MNSDKNPTPAVVLVCDRTLSADYRVLFEGIFGTMQARQTPQFFMRHLLCPPVPVDQYGRAKTAPLGLRRVEASLIDNGIVGAGDVVCTTPEYLPELLGPWVRIVGVSSSDPLGMGMSNTTTRNFFSGELYSAYWMGQMLRSLAAAKSKYKFKIVAGGAGAWQLRCYSNPLVADVIDVVYEGYFESAGPSLFADLLNDRAAAGCVCSKDTAVEHIKPIKAGSLMGVIELSRGCGRGCRFCTIADRRMEHLPVDTILSDLETNVACGIRSVVSSSEDFFRYGGCGVRPDFDRLCELLVRMRSVKGLSFMQIDHANITTVAQLGDEQLCRIKKLLDWQKPSRYLWVNMGVETANAALLAANCPGKIAPFEPEDWEDIVRRTARRMQQAGFFCVFSIILGLPGETPSDVEQTSRLVDDLAETGAVIFPIFYEPLRMDEIKSGLRFTLEQMTAGHLELFRKCYRINFRQVPKLFWDNQTCGGVSLGRRVLMQLLGRAEVLMWNSRFRRLNRTIALRGRNCRVCSNVG